MAIYEPYIGFTLGNYHSSDLGLYRISDGSEFTEDLLPSFEDKTAERVGADGGFFFGSRFTQWQREITVGFNNLTPTRLQEVKRILAAAARTPQDLVFDEDRDDAGLPQPAAATIESVKLKDLVGSQALQPTIPSYVAPKAVRTYKVKLESPPSISYVCYEEERNGEWVDILKGQMTLSFISYEPFGYGPEEIVEIKGISDTTEFGFFGLGDVEIQPKFEIIRPEGNNNSKVKSLTICNESGNEVFKLTGEENIYYQKLVLDFEKMIFKGMTTSADAKLELINSKCSFRAFNITPNKVLKFTVAVETGDTGTFNLILSYRPKYY